MTDYIRLDRAEIVMGRSFTNLDHNADDMAVIAPMVHRLRLLLNPPPALPTQPRPLLLNLREADDRHHRVVLCQPERLMAGDDLTWVGFFGRKRPEVDQRPLDAMDEELMGEFMRYPGILSYSSLELGEGNWGNLVLLASPEVKDYWRTSERHSYAVRELAPKYYLVIRLHSGLVPGGLLGGQLPVLTRTKYYDFQAPKTWRAVREISPA